MIGIIDSAEKEQWRFFKANYFTTLNYLII